VPETTPKTNKHRPTTDPSDDRFERIWSVVAGIPPGSVLNYGEVARLAGLKGRARLVGRALGRAPKQMALPWHRVVNAQGMISFKPGSGPHSMQLKLLQAEGVKFIDGKIDLDQYSPEHAIDRMLWGPPGDPTD
jgi:methylated-DNA-protein-cysteine methyltransferase-like protein